MLQAQVQSIKIGLLIPDSAKKEIIHACELALDAANQVELVVRSTEGPWGMGSKASVDLIYEDSVLAMLCALDGRNAHLAEQVAAKTQVACIECRATDPSLTQAYVPWYLRVVPSDDQQAESILKRIEELGGGKTAIICTGEYDTRMTAHSFTKNMARPGSGGPVIINISDGESTAKDLSDQLKEKDIRHLILSLNTPLISELIPLLGKEMPDLHIFGTHAFIAALPYGERDLQNGSEVGKSFENTFMEKYGYRPSMAAAYAYDGINMILAAIKMVGSDCEEIRKDLEKMDYRDGLTGRISFDNLGNRKDAAVLLEIK